MHEQTSHRNERLKLNSLSSFVNAVRHSLLLEAKQPSHIKSQQHMFLYNCTKAFSSFNTKEHACEMKQSILTAPLTLSHALNN